MGGGGIAHLAAPEIFTGFVFEPLPANLVVLLAGILQCAIAIAILTPKTRKLAALAFAVLCTAYMPLHLWDLFRDDPVIAPLSAAIFRVGVQCGFIWVGWKLWRTTTVEQE